MAFSSEEKARAYLDFYRVQRGNDGGEPGPAPVAISPEELHSLLANDREYVYFLMDPETTNHPTGTLCRAAEFIDEFSDGNLDPQPADCWAL